MEKISEKIKMLKDLRGKCNSRENRDKIRTLCNEFRERYNELKVRVEKSETLNSEDQNDFDQLKTLMHPPKEAGHAGEEAPPERTEEMKKPKEKKPKNCAPPWALTVLCGLLAAIFLLGWFLSMRNYREAVTSLSTAESKTQKAEEARAAAEAKLKECQDALAAKAVPATSTKPSAEKLSLATIGKGEGIEHAFIRQLIFNPSLADGMIVKVEGETYELTFKGNKEDSKALKKWAGWAADKIARNQGYVSRTKEVRVKYPGIVAYILQREGGNIVAKSGFILEFPFPGFQTLSSTSTSPEKPTPFKGDTQKGLQNNEYVFTAQAQTFSLSSILQADTPLFKIGDLLEQTVH